jgi:hypothetical protein
LGNLERKRKKRFLCLFKEKGPPMGGPLKGKFPAYKFSAQGSDLLILIEAIYYFPAALERGS